MTIAFKRWIARHYTFEDRKMVRTWYGPFKDTPALEGWQAEFFTARDHRFYGFKFWESWLDVEPGSIIEAIYGRHDRG